MEQLPDWLQREQVTHVEVFPARPGVVGKWPSWAAPSVVEALTAAGIQAPWQHQVEAATLAFGGQDVVIATGTGSGKSLAYQLPTLTTLLTVPKARVLYLAPTKALAADQLRALAGLDIAGVRAATLDGDTMREERDWVRQHGNFVLTNPDLLHHSLLPRHQRWSAFLRYVHFVVVDECHSYRGVFGAHVAHVLRRLRRITNDRPRFLLASATAADPAVFAARLIGRAVTAIVEDTAPRGATTFALWEPPLLPGFGAAATPAPTPEPSTAHSASQGSAIPSARRPILATEQLIRRRVPAESSATAGTTGIAAATVTRDGASDTGRGSGPSDTGGRSGASDTGSRASDTVSRASDTVSGSGDTGSGLAGELGGPSISAALPGLDAAPVRRSALRETGDLLADAVARGVRTLAFVPSRRGAEVVAAQAKRALDEVAPGLGSQVAAYRAGYLAEERRALEQALTTGELTGLATTNALELGIDVSGLDVVLLSGYPGTRSAMWQRAGRAGRAGRDALCVLIARDDPLDTYLVHHPAALFHTPVEATVFDPANPYVLAPHLCTAAAERPLTNSDLELFGAPRALIDELVAQGALRARPTGWYWTQPHRPDIDLRGTGGMPISVIEEATGRLIGTADPGSAHHHLHRGAVYTHQGRVYVVQDLDLEDGVALVEPGNPPYTTHAREVTSLDVLNVRSYVDAGPVGVFLGDVEVTSQVVSFQRRRMDSGEVLGTWPLDLPARTLRTVAVWVTLADSTLSAVDDVPGALHAAEHAAIGLLPLVASCDRWDIGGLSTARHADTEAPTIFVYDGHPGGAGFAERAFNMAEDWFGATRDTVKSCACELGCPSCVQSPKCGNGNHPLDKRGAVTVLSVLLAQLDRYRPAIGSASAGA